MGLICFITSFGPLKPFQAPVAVQDLMGLEEILQASADFTVDKIIPPSNEHN
jgi:hypothetical protein